MLSKGLVLRFLFNFISTFKVIAKKKNKKNGSDGADFEKAVKGWKESSKNKEEKKENNRLLAMLYSFIPDSKPPPTQ